MMGEFNLIVATRRELLREWRRAFTLEAPVKDVDKIAG